MVTKTYFLRLTVFMVASGGAFLTATATLHLEVSRTPHFFLCYNTKEDAPMVKHSFGETTVYGRLQPMAFTGDWWNKAAPPMALVMEHNAIVWKILSPAAYKAPPIANNALQTANNSILWSKTKLPKLFPLLFCWAAVFLKWAHCPCY